MRICLVGVGLIGGSIARALAAARPPGPGTGPVTVVAWTPAGAGPRAAARAGVVDDVATDLADAVRGADVVVLAAPAPATLDLLDALADLAPGILSARATVTDVASTKGAVVARADERGIRFVGGHPLAGRESAGFDAASADLFADRPWVVVPGREATAEDVARVEWLAAACGARTVRMEAAAHDAVAAAISHAPLVVAAALVEAVAGAPGEPERADWPVARGLAASGWRDMTRLARGDATMGAGILATNGAAVAARLRDVRGRLDAWIAELEAHAEPEALRERLDADRTRALEAPVDGSSLRDPGDEGR
jgi:prephenate dehydrogenase